MGVTELGKYSTLTLGSGTSAVTTSMMLSVLKKILGIQTTNLPRKCTEAPLFSGSAYFSNRVPGIISEKWVAHGGEISTDTVFDVRAQYFFATDPSEPWVTKLFEKSVTVIHAGWIVHCVDEAFKVPISEYILDERFVPELPYKLTSNFTAPIYVPLSELYVPLSEPGGSDDTEFGESGTTSLQTSDAPSTPTSMPRKRKREQAYFDSPSGSLVFSGFDKDGIPRRPKKQPKLRFDPSFSPDGGRSRRDIVPGPDWLRDVYDPARDDGEIFKEQGQDGTAGGLRGGYMTTVPSPDTPDEPTAANGRTSAMYQHLSVDKTLPVSSSANPIDRQEKMPSVRTIDFTNLPPSTRRWRFPTADGAKSGETGMTLSNDHKIKSPKKISFADHARVCVYMVSPSRPSVKDDISPGFERRSLSKGFEEGPEPNGKTRSNDDVQGSDDSIAEATEPTNHGDDSTGLSGVDQSENDTLALTVEEVQAMRNRLLESAEKNGVDNGQLATLFELGKTYRGMTFRHVW